LGLASFGLVCLGAALIYLCVLMQSTVLLIVMGGGLLLAFVLLGLVHSALKNSLYACAISPELTG
jgi:hypothetical protein